MPVKLSFGTAGIRARAGERDDQLNTRTVEAFAHVLLEYVRTLFPHAPQQGVCIAYDGRIDSAHFATRLSAVALGHGFVVRAFDVPCPTPLLAFATKQHGAALGLMVTASHNPPEDNGIKVYWQGGAQILSPHDTILADRLAAFRDDTEIPSENLESAQQNGRYIPLGQTDQDAYLDAVLALAPPSVQLPPPRFGYSALCGVGSVTTRALLERTQVPFLEVTSQAAARADFGGLQNPNPEHDEALGELRILAEHAQLELACCHDPDADRLAVLTRDAEDKLVRLTGDEVGALLADWVLTQEPSPAETLVVSTLVSGSLAERVVRARGASFERTLTGFKWIASQGHALAAARNLRFVFGYEEALGYCFPSMADDKDGIAALHLLLQFARTLKAREETLWGRLEQLHREHGLFVTRQITLSASGDVGLMRMRALMATLRSATPESWLTEGATRDDARLQSPASDLLTFRTSDGGRICVRPSGTEPKLKFYLEAQATAAPSEPMAAPRARAKAALDELEASIARVTQHDAQP